ncbi:hypothetical protein ACIQAA_22900 [Neobacillus sp. NPDC093182]|uniref:hypothetical protein n=1 Tax=Neobacillus sp. NPDC093182 TaxID=3364297 RepID=UPI0037F27C27
MGKVVSIAILVIGSILASRIIAAGSGKMTWQRTLWGNAFAITYTTFIFPSSSMEKDTPVVQKSALFTTGGHDYRFRPESANGVTTFTSINGNFTVGFYLIIMSCLESFINEQPSNHALQQMYDD